MRGKDCLGFIIHKTIFSCPRAVKFKFRCETAICVESSPAMSNFPEKTTPLIKHYDCCVQFTVKLYKANCDDDCLVMNSKCVSPNPRPIKCPER